MPGPDNNKRREEILRNLSPEEIQKVKEFYNLKDNNNTNTYDGLVAIEPPEWPIEDIKILGMGHRADKAYIGMDLAKGKDSYTLDYIKVGDIPKGKYFGSLTDEQRIHMQDSQYTAEWMYPAIICNTKLTHMEMLLNGYDFTDQIDSEHEQYNYFFNMRRDNVGLPRIELKVGELYELQLGRKRDIVKRMILVDIKGGLNSNKMPELYFENETTYFNNAGHRTNINHIKIWRKIENN